MGVEQPWLPNIGFVFDDVWEEEEDELPPLEEYFPNENADNEDDNDNDYDNDESDYEDDYSTDESEVDSDPDDDDWESRPFPGWAALRLEWLRIHGEEVEPTPDR